MHVVGPVLGMLTGANDDELEAPKSLMHAASVEYDAVFTVGALGDGAELLQAAGIAFDPDDDESAPGVVVAPAGQQPRFAKSFAAAMAMRRDAGMSTNGGAVHLIHEHVDLEHAHHHLAVRQRRNCGSQRGRAKVAFPCVRLATFWASSLW